jgi:hypothetical protein
VNFVQTFATIVVKKKYICKAQKDFTDMKSGGLKLLLGILVFTGFSNPANSQNYRNICSPGTTFFKDTANTILAFRRDSVYLLPGQDTVFLSYRTIIEETYNYPCFDTTNGSILGRRIYEKADGTFYFFNYSHDTITIKTQAPLNGTWRLCSLANNGRVDAKVISIGIDSVLGVTDSVKTISFQAKNSSGNNISYYLNLLTIKLSKHYGLTSMLDVYHINDTNVWDNTKIYSLAGKTDPVTGIQPFGWSDVYNLNVGDVFHYHGFQHYNWYGPEWWQIQQVISKSVSPNGDTIHYQFDDCKLTNNPWPSPSIQKTHDTISMTVIFPSLDSAGIYRLPMEFHSQWDNGMAIAAAYSRTIDYNGRMVQIINDQAYASPTDPCWEYVFEGMYAPVYYSPGLGQTGYISEWWESGITYDWENHLVYFEKGNETWGTPVANDCSTLLGTDRQLTPVETSIVISPDPVDQSALVTIPGLRPGETANLAIYNETGSKVFSGQLHSSTYTFRRNSLPAGIYFIVVSGDNGKIRRNTKMVLR